MRVQKGSAGAILALGLALLLVVPGAAADPTVTGGGQGSLEILWDLDNPANYTASDVIVEGGQASLRRVPGELNLTTRSDFADNASLSNVDLDRRPGDVVLNRTSGPLPATATYTSRLVGDGRSVSWGTIAWNTSSFDDHSDEFEGTSLDPRWQWLNPPASYAVGARPGWLTFNTTRPSDFWNGQYSGQYLYQSVSGEFQVEVRLQTSGLTTPGQKAGLMVMLPPPFNPDTFWASVHRVYSGGVRVQAVTTFNGNTYVNATVVADPEYLMIRRTANGTLETYFSGDGRNWTFLAYVGGFGNSFTTHWVGVFTGHPGSGSPMTVSIDYVRFSFQGANPEVQLETRTGNATDPADPSWTPWSSPHSNRLGSRIDRRAAYLQYRILLSTSSLYVRPLVGDVNLSWEYRASAGEVATQLFPLGRTLIWDVLALDANARGGSIEVSYSPNGSAAWTPVPLGSPNLTMWEALRLRVRLVTPDPSVSPSVSSIRVGLRPETPPPFPSWILLLPLALLPSWIVVTRLLRGPFRPTDLFLIHADGRLVLHEGGRHLLIRDEIAASGMFTLVARFVKDSFGETGKEGGELKSLQVDRRDVAIAKGSYLFLALVGQGPRPRHMESAMSRFLGAIEWSHRPYLEAWDGLGEDLGDLRNQLQWFLRKGHRRPNPIPPGTRVGSG